MRDDAEQLGQADPLEAIAAVAQATDKPPADPKGAAAALQATTATEEGSGDSAPAATPPKPRKRGGWPKGKRRTGRAKPTATVAEPAKAAGGARTKAELATELERVTARLSEYEAGRVPVDPIEAAARSIEGTVLMMGLALQDSPYADLAFNEKDAQSLGDIWAPVLEPHLGTIIDRAPLALALAQTARMIYPKYRTMRARQIVVTAVDNLNSETAAQADPDIRPRGAAGEGAQ